MISLVPPRVTVFGHRVHHGPPGLLLMAYGLGKGSAAWFLAGAVVVASDLKDRGVWLSDFIRHPAYRNR